LNEATRVERALRDAATEAAVDLGLAEKFLGPSANRAARISALEARAKATDAAWRAALVEVNRLHGAHFAAMREWVRLSSALERCNKGCGTQPERPPDPPVNAGDPPVTPPSPPVPPPSDAPVLAPECERCRELAIKINSLLKQRASARSVLDGIEATRASVRAEQAERSAELEKLKQRPANQRQDGSEASVQDRLDFTHEHLELLDEYQKNWEAEIKRLDADIAPLQERFDKCNTQCKPVTETGSLFDRVSGTVRGAGGRTMWIGDGDKRCAEIMAVGGEFGFTTTCTSDDSGPAIAFGADVRYQVNRELDVAVMLRTIDAGAATVDASQSLGNAQSTTRFTTTAFAVGITAVIGYSPTSKTRFYTGGGPGHVSGKVTGDHRATVNGRTETASDSEELSAWGTHLRAGGEFYVTDRIGVYGEGARFWFRGGELGRLSQLVVGVTYLVGARRW
jgi:hypothetical protein